MIFNVLKILKFNIKNVISVISTLYSIIVVQKNNLLIIIVNNLKQPILLIIFVLLMCQI